MASRNLYIDIDIHNKYGYLLPKKVTPHAVISCEYVPGEGLIITACKETYHPYQLRIIDLLRKLNSLTPEEQKVPIIARLEEIDMFCHCITEVTEYWENGDIAFSLDIVKHIGEDLESIFDSSKHLTCEHTLNTIRKNYMV